jgi:hypothetical protein
MIVAIVKKKGYRKSSLPNMSVENSDTTNLSLTTDPGMYDIELFLDIVSLFHEFSSQVLSLLPKIFVSKFVKS